MSPNINYGPWVIIMYQYWLTNCSKCTPLMLIMGFIGRRERCSGIWELLYFLLNFSVTLKLLKKKNQFSSVTQSCPTLCDPMNHSTPGLPVHDQLPEFTQTHVHRVSDAIQPSHPLSSPSPPAPNFSQHQSLFQRVNSSHEVAKVLEFQL